MSFVERLRQEDLAKAQSKQRLEAQQEAIKKERLKAEEAERERHAQRIQIAERFREESGVGNAVAKLIEYLSTPTIPVTRTSFSDGIHDSWIEYVGRGSSGIRKKTRLKGFLRIGSTVTSYSEDYFPFSQRHPDSVFDTVHWDTADLGHSLHSEKYIAVETCPDGTIVFYAGWIGSTTIGLEKWRTGNKEQLFEKALEKAYKHPGINKYSVWHEPQPPSGFG